MGTCRTTGRSADDRTGDLGGAADAHCPTVGGSARTIGTGAPTIRRPDNAGTAEAATSTRTSTTTPASRRSIPPT